MARDNKHTEKNPQNAPHNNETLHKVHENVDKAADYIADKGEDFINKTSEMTEKVQECIHEYCDSLTNYIKKSPMTSIVIAGAVGALIAKMMKK